MKQLKRTSSTCLLCIFLCIFFLVACSKGNQAKVPEKTTETTETDSDVVKKSEVKKWSKEYDLKDVVFTENDAYSYTLSEIGIDPDGNARLDIRYENKTDQEIMFTFRNVYLNRYDCIYVFGDETVAPGETKKSSIQIPAEDLADYKITELEEIKIRFYIESTALGNERIEEVHTMYPTGLSAETYQPAPHPYAEGSFDMLNNDTMTFSIQEVEKNELNGNILLWIYTECKVPENTVLSIENFKVNGKDIYYKNGLGYMEGNTRALNWIVIDDTGVNSISDIQKIEFDIHTKSNGQPYHDHLVYEK